MGDKVRNDEGAGGPFPKDGELFAGSRNEDAPESPDDLRRLVEQASRGNREAEGRLLKSVRARALRHATRLGRKTGAADTAQNVVVAVLGTLRSDPESLNPATIGGFVAVLASRDWKDERDRRAMRDTADLSPLNPAGEPDPADAAARDEAWAGVRDAVARLPEEDRHLVVLRYWEGLSQREIARRVGMAKTSVARRMERVEAELRGELGEPKSDAGGVFPSRYTPPPPEFPETGDPRPATRDRRPGRSALKKLICRNSRSGKVLRRVGPWGHRNRRFFLGQNCGSSQ